MIAAGILFAGLPAGGGFVAFALLAAVVAFSAQAPPPKPLGPANRVTLVRLAVTAALAGGALAAAVSPKNPGAAPGWTACMVYVAAALGDFADGAVARRTKSASVFGARLDAETDALGMAAASGIAVIGYGVLPDWYLAAGAARYLFGAALFLEAQRGRAPRPLAPSPFRRRLAGFQMGLLAVCLAPGIEPRWALPSAVALGGPFLAGFLRDYLIVSGRIDPDGARSRRFVSLLRRLRPAVCLAAAGAAAGLGAAKAAGWSTGSLALGAFFLAWLLRSPGPGARRRSLGGG